MWLLFVGIALAGPPPTLDFAWRAGVTCPERGLCWIEVPSELLAQEQDRFLLVRKNGSLNEQYGGYPYAVLSERAAPAVLRFPRISATAEPEVVSLAMPDDCVVESVEVEPGAGSYLAAARVEVQITGQSGWQPGPWELLSSGLVDEEAADLRPPAGHIEALRVRFDRPWADLPPSLSASMDCRDAGWVRPAEVALTPGPWGPLEDGRTRYTFDLPGRGKLIGLELEPEGDVFERRVAVGTWEPVDGELRATSQYAGTIERIKVGDLAVNHTRLLRLDLNADRLVVDVDDGPDRPLDIPVARALLARRVLVVRDAGPLTLYATAGGPAPEYDLQFALSELVRQPFEWATVSAVEPNAATLSAGPGVRSLEPGAPVDPARFLYERAVVAQGLTRISLPLDLLARARPDLTDLRLIDAQSRQIPFIVDWGAVDQVLEGVTLEPEVDGATSRLRLRMPLSPVAVSSITLHSPDSDFSRTVSVYGNINGERSLISVVGWDVAAGQDASKRAMINLRIDGSLLVEIENGDNRVVTLDGATVRAPSASVVAYIPDQAEARLVYGDAAELQRDGIGPFRRVRDNGWDKPLGRPSYDAEDLLGLLSTRRPAEATLGPEVSRESGGATEADRDLASVGIGVFVLGLIGLVGWLLKGVKAPDEPETPAGGAPTG